jgi:hypothetical protein
MTTTKKDSIYFITEQACCLAQSTGRETEHFKACEQAVRYLAKGDPEILQSFAELTEAVKLDPDADYDTEQYEGKDADVRAAVAELELIAKDPGTPAEDAKALKHTADIIADFYGLEL